MIGCQTPVRSPVRVPEVIPTPSGSDSHDVRITELVPSQDEIVGYYGHRIVPVSVFDPQMARYLDEFRAFYTERRDFLVAALRDAGFAVAEPDGTYFVLADFTAVHDGDDREFARWLTTEHGVAAIPPSAFYPAHPEEGRRLVRFAFCKRMETLESAADRLRRIRP